MYTVFLAGGIASGKSLVASWLHDRGAYCIDLDQVAREVVEPGSPLLAEIAEAFGADVINENGMLNRVLLGKRAFDTPEDTARLEAIEMPAIKARLIEMLNVAPCAAKEPKVCVVEVPLLDRVEDLFDLADEILVVITPLERRREFAIKRGMSATDFDARVAKQPSDEYLREHATYVIENTGDLVSLMMAVDAWWDCLE